MTELIVHSSRNLAEIKPAPEDRRAEKLRQIIIEKYKGTEERLPYHGLPHVLFIGKYAEIFGEDKQRRLQASGSQESIRVNLLRPGGYVHDTDKLAQLEGGDKETVARRAVELRTTFLKEAEYTDEEIASIESMVQEEESSNDRLQKPSNWEVACLRDAGIAHQVSPERKALYAKDAISKETGEDRQLHAARTIKRMEKWTNNMKTLGYESIFYTEKAEELFGPAIAADREDLKRQLVA